MRTKIEAVVGAELKSPPFRVTALGGGDLNEASRIELVDGRVVFMKTHPQSSPSVFAAEARGLKWLEVDQGPRIPEVLAVSSEDSATGYLVLEWIETGPRPADFGERFGRELAALHRAGAPSFGYVENNFLGPLPQDNSASSDWAGFYAEKRIAPLLNRARDKGLTSTALERSVEAVLNRMSTLVGPEESPSRLHGDLWAGNVMCDEEGRPVLFDPAVYGGHREIDLAMLRLFGFSHERVFDAYAEVFPLSDGAEARVCLYQLYPLLVHLNLFGASYLGGCERAASTAASIA